MSQKTVILTAEQAQKKIIRLAYEILENNIEASDIYLIGIKESGLILAEILKTHLHEICQHTIHIIPLYIDKKNPIDCSFEIDFDPSDKRIILVDDVSNTGKTLMYALRPLLSTMCDTIQVAVLIERQHKLFPVASSYIGMKISTTIQNHISVNFRHNKIESVTLE
jgi:Pyrimidine operon attenuation protein/uracil phosphoribosyltransferase